jgi:hypothetical protein
MGRSSRLEGAEPAVGKRETRGHCVVTDPLARSAYLELWAWLPAAGCGCQAKADPNRRRAPDRPARDATPPPRAMSLVLRGVPRAAVGETAEALSIVNVWQGQGLPKARQILTALVRERGRID